MTRFSVVLLLGLSLAGTAAAEPVVTMEKLVRIEQAEPPVPRDTPAYVARSLRLAARFAEIAARARELPPLLAALDRAPRRDDLRSEIRALDALVQAARERAANHYLTAAFSAGVGRDQKEAALWGVVRLPLTWDDDIARFTALRKLVEEFERSRDHARALVLWAERDLDAGYYTEALASFQRARARARGATRRDARLGEGRALLMLRRYHEAAGVLAEVAGTRNGAVDVRAELIEALAWMPAKRAAAILSLHRVPDARTITVEVDVRRGLLEAERSAR